jgi:hypothetical protein
VDEQCTCGHALKDHVVVRQFMTCRRCPCARSAGARAEQPRPKPIQVVPIPESVPRPAVTCQRRPAPEQRGLGAELETLDLIAAFLFAGKATFSVVNAATAVRHSYSLREGRSGGFLLDAIDGQGNDRWYVPVGMIRDMTLYRYTASWGQRVESELANDHVKVATIHWLLAKLRKRGRPADDDRVAKCEALANDETTTEGERAAARAAAVRLREARHEKLPTPMKVFHEGECARCKLRLTDPESVRTGMGPTCREKAGI